MPLFLSLLIGKILLRLSRWRGGGGSALPGLVAEKLTPDLVAKLARGLKEGCIIITGTNGKTTSAKMLAAILKESGLTVVGNRAGSNLSRGVASALIEHSDLGGKVRADIGLFEVDEAAMADLAGRLRPRVIVVLNLFRDQLDRYGELDKTASLVGQGIAASDALVLLNADDPLVVSLYKYSRNPARVRYFGNDDTSIKKLPSDHTADSTHCPICGQPLIYRAQFFGHLGHYRCRQGHFDRPEPKLALQKLVPGELDQTLELKHVKVRLQLPGLYNAYNALAALAAGQALGVNLKHAAKVLEGVEAAFGRVERITLGDNQLFLLLIKNPTGFNQVIQTFLVAHPEAPALIVINDNFADGRDVSWLWDAAIEDLAGRTGPVLVSGIRAADMALRLRYAGIEAEVIEEPSKALDRLVELTSAGQTAYLLPTYTAMLNVRRELAKRTNLKDIYE